MARVTLRTVADRVGVSVMTVSNAFSRPDQLSKELRGRILAVADEMGYAGPNPTARSLSRGETGTVGVLRAESAAFSFTDEQSAVLLAAIADELARTGRALTLLPPVGADPTPPPREIAMDGAIVHSCPPASGALTRLLRRRIPVVQLDQQPEPDVSGVNIDDRGGAEAAARHLVDLGHRRIATVTLDGSAWDADLHPAREREAGWAAVLTGAGITSRTVVARASTLEAGAEAGEELLAGPDRPTAVLAVSDAVALGVLRAARRARVAVPGDLSVVGFDDVAAASAARPRLTTVAQDIAAKGRTAVEMLTADIEQTHRDQTPEPRRTVLPATLVVRGSTAPPPDPAS